MEAGLEDAVAESEVLTLLRIIMHDIQKIRASSNTVRCIYLGRAEYKAFLNTGTHLTLRREGMHNDTLAGYPVYRMDEVSHLYVAPGKSNG